LSELVRFKLCWSVAVLLLLTCAAFHSFLALFYRSIRQVATRGYPSIALPLSPRAFIFSFQFFEIRLAFILVVLQNDMGLLDYIRTADPRKVQAVEVQKGEEQVTLFDSIKHCFVSLNASAAAHQASGSGSGAGAEVSAEGNVVEENVIPEGAFLNPTDPECDVTVAEEDVAQRQPEKAKRKKLLKRSDPLPAKRLRTDHPSLASGTGGKSLASLRQSLPEGSLTLGTSSPADIPTHVTVPSSCAADAPVYTAADIVTSSRGKTLVLPTSGRSVWRFNMGWRDRYVLVGGEVRAEHDLETLKRSFEVSMMSRGVVLVGKKMHEIARLKSWQEEKASPRRRAWIMDARRVWRSGYVHGIAGPLFPRRWHKILRYSGMDEVLDCFLLDGPFANLPEAAYLQPCLEQLSVPIYHADVIIVSHPLFLLNCWVGFSTSAVISCVEDLDTDEDLGSVIEGRTDKSYGVWEEIYHDAIEKCRGSTSTSESLKHNGCSYIINISYGGLFIGWSVRTVEHLLPDLEWTGVDNCCIEVVSSDHNDMSAEKETAHTESHQNSLFHKLYLAAALACYTHEAPASQAEKMRSEIGEMRRRSAKRLIVAANELKTKEDVITRLNQVNWSLEEKLKSLLVENQIWRELAQTNEATTNNLQQLLAQAQLQELEQQEQTLVNDDIDDGESCCGSNYEEHGTKCLKCGKKELLDNETS
ncbi:probable BOI-related E3 ubiquitin-protein ligase 3, partial [Tanacetum coccineum]